VSEETMHDQLEDNNKVINFYGTKSVVPMALVLCNYTHASNAIGMADIVTFDFSRRKKYG